MSSNVSYVVEIVVKDGETDNVKALIDEMVNATKANEPGVLNYEFYTSEDGGIIHVHERYTDSAAAMIHLAAFGERFVDRLLAIAEPTRFFVYGEPSAEVLGALAAFGAVHMAKIGGFSR